VWKSSRSMRDPRVNLTASKYGPISPTPCRRIVGPFATLQTAMQSARDPSLITTLLSGPKGGRSQSLAGCRGAQRSRSAAGHTMSGTSLYRSVGRGALVQLPHLLEPTAAAAGGALGRASRSRKSVYYHCVRHICLDVLELAALQWHARTRWIFRVEQRCGRVNTWACALRSSTCRGSRDVPPKRRLTNSHARIFLFKSNHGLVWLVALGRSSTTDEHQIFEREEARNGTRQPKIRNRVLHRGPGDDRVVQTLYATCTNLDHLVSRIQLEGFLFLRNCAARIAELDSPAVCRICRCNCKEKRCWKSTKCEPDTPVSIPPSIKL
jgi:hypothetical protein